MLNAGKTMWNDTVKANCSLARVSASKDSMGLAPPLEQDARSMIEAKCFDRKRPCRVQICLGLANGCAQATRSACRVLQPDGMRARAEMTHLENPRGSLCSERSSMVPRMCRDATIEQEE